MPSFTAHPYGRIPIGVDQPPSSSDNYPLMEVPEPLRGLLAGFRLAYEDPNCVFVPPFSIYWLYGFGSDPPETGPETIIPVHDRGIIIKDGNGLVVFDSTTCELTDYSVCTVATRLSVTTWHNQYAACHLVHHIAWQQDDIDASIAKEYASEIWPDAAILDPSTVMRMPPRVKSVKHLVNTLTGNVGLEAGYNLSLAIATTPDQDILDDITASILDGDLPVSFVESLAKPITIELDAVVGAGLGRTPGCENDMAGSIRKINGSKPNVNGDLVLTTEGSYRWNRPVRLLAESPRQYELWHQDTPNPQAAILLTDDGQPCCSCDDYVYTENGIVRQADRWRATAVYSATVRDIHADNLRRWERARQCWRSRRVVVTVIPERGAKFSGGASYCNNTGCCLSNVLLRLTVKTYRNGLPVSLAGDDCRMTLVDDGSPGSRLKPYVLAGDWNVYEARFESLEPGASLQTAFRFRLTESLPDQDLVQVVATIHFPDVTKPGAVCNYEEAQEPVDLAAIWADSAVGIPTYPLRAIGYSDISPLPSHALIRRVCDADTGSQLQ